MANHGRKICWGLWGWGWMLGMAPLLWGSDEALRRLPFPYRMAMERFAEQQQSRREKHWARQAQENRDFWKSLKGATATEILQALKAHRDRQFNENQAFRTEQHGRRVAFITWAAGKFGLPEDQVAAILARSEERFQNRYDHYQAQFEEDMAFIEGLIAQPPSTVEELKAILREHFKKQRIENQAFRQEAKAGS